MESGDTSALPEPVKLPTPGSIVTSVASETVQTSSVLSPGSMVCESEIKDTILGESLSVPVPILSPSNRSSSPPESISTWAVRSISRLRITPGIISNVTTVATTTAPAMMPPRVFPLIRCFLTVAAGISAGADAFSGVAATAAAAGASSPTVKLWLPMPMESPSLSSCGTLGSILLPLTVVPLLLPRSVIRAVLPSYSTWAWCLEICVSSSTSRLSALRPIDVVPSLREYSVTCVPSDAFSMKDLPIPVLPSVHCACGGVIQQLMQECENCNRGRDACQVALVGPFDKDAFIYILRLATPSVQP